MSSWGHQEGNKLMQRRDQVDSGTTTSVASLLVLGGGGGKTPKCTDKNNMYLYCASERLRNIYFQDSKYICIQCHYTVNAVSFNYLWSEASTLGGGVVALPQ